MPTDTEGILNFSIFSIFSDTLKVIKVEVPLIPNIQLFPPTAITISNMFDSCLFYKYGASVES